MSTKPIRVIQILNADDLTQRQLESNHSLFTQVTASDLEVDFRAIGYEDTYVFRNPDADKVFSRHNSEETA